jgi:hypothetical protein
LYNARKAGGLDAMGYRETKYKDLESVCINKYGDEKGRTVYARAEELFLKMREEADYRNSDVIKRHMDTNIFPVLAYYMALLGAGYSKDDAYADVLEETQKYAAVAKERNGKLGKMPFGYLLLRLFSGRFMRTNYPDEGWETEWVRRDREEVHLNFRRCVYFDVVSQYGHPELCAVFCAHDITAFAGYLPNIRFERSGTIGEGKELCDFHFKNGKLRSKQ